MTDDQFLVDGLHLFFSRNVYKAKARGTRLPYKNDGGARRTF